MTDQVSLKTIINQVSDEKGVDPAVLIEAIEQAILTAARRQFGPERELEAEYSPATDAVELKMIMRVVDMVENADREISLEEARRHGLDDPEDPLQDGDDLDFEIFYLDSQADAAREQDAQFGELLGIQQARSGFGRIAAQTAKQVIIQRVREAERERVYHEFKNKIGEMVTGVVRRFERGSNIIVELDRAGEGRGRVVEALLPMREQTPRESYRPGDRIVALLKNIDREARGPQVILSRSDEQLLVKLFQQEVPEIEEGIVRIVQAAREPGARSKIAVSSRDSDVDPVGACVGMKGSRVQAVVQELRGEKIDIVTFDRDPARFVCNAIAPAEVIRVVIDDANQTMDVVVPDAKLSLAIGRRGQNVRLAGQLTGWKLDIIDESRFRQMEDRSIRALARINDEELARSLYRMGFRTLDEVADAPRDELLLVEGIDEKNVDHVQSGARNAFEELREEWIAEAAQRPDLPTERERLQLVRGITERLAQQLERAGYGTVEKLAAETDAERIAIATQLPLERTKELPGNARLFLDKHWASIQAGVAKAKEVADERVAQRLAAQSDDAPLETAESEA